MFKYLFTGRLLLLTLLVLALAVVFCGLGVWQTQRLNQRLTLIEHEQSRMAAAPITLNPNDPIDPAALDYRRVMLRGSFDATQEVLLRNRSVDGVTGYHLITPFRLSGSDKVMLVDRGWIPYDQATPEQRTAFRPAKGEVAFEAIVRMSQEGTTSPVDPPLAASQQRLDAWFRVNIPRIQQQIGTPLQPVFAERQPDHAGPQLPPITTASEADGPGNHLSYAIQWFSFAIILLGGYCAITYQQWQRRRGIPQRTSDVVRQHA